ncbi:MULTISPECIES: hypothetical protein [unclassified Lysinibacillus]|uniref:hypothetical protein n=1 Tax=unclassified Lysinibacillus TaxID=2636778 RepID=UPI003817DAC6
MIIFAFIIVYFMPILGIIFCLNLVSILTKIKKDEKTTKNTFWLTLSYLWELLWSKTKLPTPSPIKLEACG